MRYHARPLIAVVIALGVLELGYAGNPKIGSMPTAYPGLDGPIAAGHFRVDRGGRPVRDAGGIPEYGGRFAAPALVMATADTHPRAIAYVSRIPASTLDAIMNERLLHVPHQDAALTFPPVTVPLTAAAAAGAALWAKELSSLYPLTAAQVAAGRRRAARSDIGWVVVWY